MRADHDSYKMAQNSNQINYAAGNSVPHAAATYSHNAPASQMAVGHQLLQPAAQTQNPNA